MRRKAENDDVTLAHKVPAVRCSCSFVLGFATVPQVGNAAPFVAAETVREQAVTQQGSLVITKRTATEIAGEYGLAGSLVSFSMRHDQAANKVAGFVEVNGIRFDLERDLKVEKVRYTVNNQALNVEAKQTLVTLATEYDRSIGLFRARQNGVEYLLGRVIAYFSEAPVGYVIPANEVTKTPMKTVDPSDPSTELTTFFDQRARLVVSCAAARASGDLVAAQACEVADQDGLSGIANCRPYNFTNYHDACQTNEPPAAAHGFIGVTQPTGPCSTNCLGGCGPGCVIGQPFTRDCADHDSCCRDHGGCTDPNDVSCGDEYSDAADDFLFAPCCGCSGCIR